MKVMIKSLPLMICVVGIAGCSSPFGTGGYFRDKSGDYSEARTAKPANIPEGLNPKPQGSILVIPPIANPQEKIPEQFVVPRPNQELIIAGVDSGYSIESSGSKVWILAAQKTKNTWSKLNSFFVENSWSLRLQSAEHGIVETDWINLEGENEDDSAVGALAKLVRESESSSMGDRFYIKISTDEDLDTSKINIQHKRRLLDSSGSSFAEETDKWNNMGELSKQMCESLASDMITYFVENADNYSVSYLSQGESVNAELTIDGNDNPLLKIKDLPYSQSWEVVGQALISSGITVLDRNRSAGVFFLSAGSKDIRKPKEGSGFFSWLFGSNKKEKKIAKEMLHLRVSQFLESVHVTVEKNSTTSADKEESQKLLELIKHNLK